MAGLEILKSWKPLDVVITLGGGVFLLLILSAATSVSGSETLAELFAFDEEGNVVTWYAALLWLTLAFVLRLITSKYQRNSRPQLARATSALGYLAIFLSIEEATQVGLKIRLIIQEFDMTPAGLDPDQIWLLLYGSALVVMLVTISAGLAELSKIAPKCATGLAAGAAILVAAGYGLEIIPSVKSLSFEPVLEETLELAAVIVMIWGAMHGLGRTHLVERDEVQRVV